MTFGNILVTGPNGFEQIIPLGGTQLWIGSAHNNDVVIRGRGVGPHHAIVNFDPQRRLMVARDAEDVTKNGGSVSTFDLSLLDRRRDLAWIGDYVLCYQPATWDNPTQPMRLADLSSDRYDSVPTSQDSADESALLQRLLNQDIAQQPTHQSHEAATLLMPMLALAAHGD